MEFIKKRIFYIFLIVNMLLWSCLQLTRNIISIDAMEAITWGNLISFGTNKHPPLSGWLISGFYHLTGGSDFAVYLLGQLCILVGFIFIYKLAKFFVSEEKAFCSTMILEACIYYTYYIYIDNFNCNVLLMAFWPMVTYYFYKSLKENQTKDWLLFGLTSGLAFLGKYQIVFLFFAMFIYLIIADRKQFKQKGMYLAILTGLIVIAPHVIWLFNNDFFSFAYMIDRTASETHNLPLILVKLSHLFYPVKFIVDQILVIGGCITIYLLTALHAKNISTNKDGNKSDKIFLLSVGILPILAQGFMAVYTGSRVPGIWGSIMIGFSGILLFYFFPIKFKKDTFYYFSKWVFASMIISAIVLVNFAIFHTKSFIAFPYQKIIPDFNQKWEMKNGSAELKYVGGNMEVVFPFKYYNPKNPTVILESFGHKNPWIDHEDVIHSGALIVAKDEEDLTRLVKDMIYLLPENYKIEVEKYDYKVCNKINKCKEKEIYYSIIPPM